MGIALDVTDDRGRTTPDPRKGKLHAVAVALPHDDKSARDVLTFDAREDLMQALGVALRGADSNEDESLYVVFEHAQAALRFLAPRGIAPARFGCLATMYALLAEGLYARPRSIDEAVAESFQRELVPPMATATQALARQADALVPLMKHLTPELRQAHLSRLYDVECRLVSAVGAMERAGVAFDTETFAVLARGWREEREITTSAERIARLDKLLSTYAHWGEQWADDDGRIRCLLHPLATDSGRFSCSDPNLQQVPSEHTAPGFRGCFRASPGNVLVVADYAQIELRVAAQLAPCDALARVFREGRDPHRATAATLTGKPESEITSHERKLAKAINFGFLFGMGAKRFRGYAADSYGLDLSDHEAQRARAAFFDTYPGVAAWHARTSRLSKRSRSEDVTVHTVLGRRKRFESGRFSFPAALNIPVQGTAAEGFKLAMIELHERLPSIGGSGVLTVHDEYLAEVPVAEAERGRQLVVEAMVAGMRQVVDRVPIEVEAHVVEDWGAS